MVTLGSARFTIAAGHRGTATIRLNATGRRLLHSHPHGLAVTIRVNRVGAAPASRRTTLRTTARR
jgi:hypothetical protein